MKTETNLGLCQLQTDIAPTDWLNKIYTGDCLELLPRLPAASVNMILCDLLYGMTARNAWDKVIPMESLWEQYRRIIKPNGVIVLTGQGLFSARLMLAAPDLYKYSLVWRKNKLRGHLNAKRQPLRIHEDILVFYSHQPTYHPQMTSGHPKMHAAYNKRSGSNYNEASGAVTKGGATESYPTSVLDIPVVNNDDPTRIHPTQKPIELGEYLIKTYTNPGDIVLDNCCGSGAFLMAAKGSGRHYVGMEADPVFAAHAQEWVGRTKATVASSISIVENRRHVFLTPSFQRVNRKRLGLFPLRETSPATNRVVFW